MPRAKPTSTNTDELADLMPEVPGDEVAESDGESAEKPIKAPKVKLTAEERRDAVRTKRAAVVDNFFASHGTFEYVGPIDCGEDRNSWYTDVTGNKGRKGHVIRDTASGEEITVGPGTLEKGVERGAIAGYVKPTRTPKVESTEDAAEPADEPVNA